MSIQAPVNMVGSITIRPNQWLDTKVTFISPGLFNIDVKTVKEKISILSQQKIQLFVDFYDKKHFYVGNLSFRLQAVSHKFPSTHNKDEFCINTYSPGIMINSYFPTDSNKATLYPILPPHRSGPLSHSSSTSSSQTPQSFASLSYELPSVAEMANDQIAIPNWHCPVSIDFYTFSRTSEQESTVSVLGFTLFGSIQDTQNVITEEPIGMSLRLPTAVRKVTSDLDDNLIVSIDSPGPPLRARVSLKKGFSSFNTNQTCSLKFNFYGSNDQSLGSIVYRLCPVASDFSNSLATSDQRIQLFSDATNPPVVNSYHVINRRESHEIYPFQLLSTAQFSIPNPPVQQSNIGTDTLELDSN